MCALHSHSTFAALCSLSGCLGSRTARDLPLRLPLQSFLVSERRVGKQWVNGQINDLARGAGTEGERGTPNLLPLQWQISSRKTSLEGAEACTVWPGLLGDFFSGAGEYIYSLCFGSICKCTESSTTTWHLSPHSLQTPHACTASN